MSRDLAIDTYLLHQYVQRNLYNSLLVLDRCAILSIDTYIFLLIGSER